MFAKLFGTKKEPNSMSPALKSALERYVPPTKPPAFAPSIAMLNGSKEYNAFMKSKKKDIADVNPSMSISEVHASAKNEWFVSKGKPQLPIIPKPMLKKHGKQFLADVVMVAAMEDFINKKTSSGKGSDAYKAAKAEWHALDAAAKWKCMEPLVSPLATERKMRAIAAKASRGWSGMPMGAYA